MKKILLVSDEIPGEVTGGQRSILHRVNLLSKHCNIDLICNNYNAEIALKLTKFESLFNNVIIVPQKRDLRKPYSFKKIVKSFIQIIFSIYPREVFLAKNESIREYIVMNQNKYDTILIENVNTAINLTKEKLIIKKTYVILHNIENKLMKSFSIMNFKNRNLLKSLFLCLEYLKYNLYEKMIWKNFNIICISKSDQKYLENRFFKSTYLPQNVPSRTNFWKNPDSNYLVFNSNLSYRPNIQGLEWFIKNVLEDLLIDFPDFMLFVTGHINHEFSAILSHNNIVYTGFLEEDKFEQLLLNSRGVVAPIFTGSGVKIKILDAMSLGLPVVSSMHCVEGLDFTINILSTNNPKKFKEFCLKILTKSFVFENYNSILNKKDQVEKMWINKLNLNA